MFRVASMIAILMSAMTVEAAVVDQELSYSVCMALAREHPQRAFEQAQNWRELGGGDAADHCIAIALLGMGQHGEAAARLESLAQEVKGTARFKAGLLGQAAQARLLANDPGRAESLLNAALGLVPDDADLLVDRAVVRAAAAAYEDAIRDLDRALAIQPGRAEALAFRAAAKRHMDDLAGASLDAEAALSLDPTLPEALLERGILRRINGDDAGARRDWMQILALVHDSDAADAARTNLQRMDVMDR